MQFYASEIQNMQFADYAFWGGVCLRLNCHWFQTLPACDLINLTSLIGSIQVHAGSSFII